MNGFVLGLQQASKHDPIPFSALIDTKSDPEATKSAARDVVSTSVSLAAGFTDNNSVFIAGPFFQRARVPFLSIGATDPALPQVVGNSIFLTPFGDNTQAAAGRRVCPASVRKLGSDPLGLHLSIHTNFAPLFPHAIRGARR